jgi:DNA-binding beta-propeller fold protein YncE
VLRPGEGVQDPLLGLAKALIGGNPADGVGLPELLTPGIGPEALAAHLQASADDPSFPFRQALARVRDEAQRERGLLAHEAARLVLVVDQLEELFTRNFDPTRRALFVRVLAGLARSGVVWVVATMRNDLWHRAAEIPQLIELVEAGARLDLPQPDGAEIIEIVRRPAAAAGIAFEKDPETGVGLDALVARASAEEPGALPLLSVMLESLYERDIAAEGGRVLTVAGYRELGELRGAIARRADQALAALAATDPEAAKALPRLLRELVTAAGDGTATSRPARLDVFSEGGPEARLMEAFLAPEARLLVASVSGGQAEVRLAHESLLENWPVAREQIAADRRDLQTRARLEGLQRRWAEAESRQEKKSALLTGLNLAEGVDLAARWEMPKTEGLGAYVAQSARADRWRRRTFAIAASVLLLIFAAIAAMATLQWRRADEQTAIARQAEETEREARAGAEAARADALNQRDRADQERARAVAALRQTKREATRTLAAQADLAAGRNEIRRALSLAVQAGQTERDVLEPGESAASEPALLKALSEVREVLHVRSPPDQWTSVAHDLLGDTRLAYADSKQGLVIVDLETRRVLARTKLPPNVLPTAVRSAPSAGVVVLAGVRTVLVIDAETGAVRADLRFEDRIAHLDVHDATRKAVIAVGTGIGLIDLDTPVQPALISVPDAKADVLVGQVRFAPDGRSIYVGYGVAVLAFQRDEERFVPTPVELVSERAGFDRSVVEAVNAKGLLILVSMQPDPTRERLLLHTWAELKAVKPDSGEASTFERDAPDISVLGVSFTDQARSGAPKEAVLVTGRVVETGHEIQLRYVMDDAKPLAFESFRISAADLGNEKPVSCQVSRHVSFLVCQYRGKANQGLMVWRLLGGKHRLERVVGRALTASSGAAPSLDPPRLLVAADAGLVWLPDSRSAAVPHWGTQWRLREAEGSYLWASSTQDQKVQVFQVGLEGTVRPVLGPVDGFAVALDAAAGRALVAAGDRLALYDLGSGQRLWSVPGLGGLKAARLADGIRAVGVTGEAAYVFDAASGRISASFPIRTIAEGDAVIEPRGRWAAFVAAEGVQLLNLDSGRIQTVSPAGAGAKLAFAPDGGRVYVGREDGSISAVDLAGVALWTIGSPIEQSFATSAWPGQPPRGTVLQIAVSRDGRRIAVVRQDVAALDIHDTSKGAHLTQLTPPWSHGAPAGAAFEGEDVIVTAWAVHAMARDRPRGVTAHALPPTFERALAAAEARLAGLAVWRPEEPGPAGPAAPN